MPLRYKRRRKGRKRGKRKRKPRRKRNIIANITSGPFPNNLVRKLRYATCIGLNPGAFAIASHSFRCNSIYDPDSTGVGHQPLGRDEISQFYGHYSVLSSKITAYFEWDNSVPNSTTLCMIAYDGDSTFTPTSIDWCMEYPHTKYSFMTDLAVKPVTLKYGWSLSKKPKALRSDCKGAVGANPTEQDFWHLIVGNCGGADIANVRVNVRIEYIVKFLDPKMNMNQS